MADDDYELTEEELDWIVREFQHRPRNHRASAMHHHGVYRPIIDAELPEPGDVDE